MAGNELRSTMRDFPPGPPVKVLLLGEEKAGKTSLMRLIAEYANAADSCGEDLSWKRSLMSLHRESLQIIKTTGGVQRAEVSLDGGAVIHFVDMPGVEEREGAANEGMESRTHNRHLQDAIRHTDYLNCAVLVVNGSKTKLAASAAHELKIVSDLMPSGFLDKILVVATRSDAPQRRALPATELKATFGREPLIAHIENPFGRLSGLKEDELKRIIKDHDTDKDGDDSPAAEIRREVRKSVRATSELLRMLKPFPPTTVPASAGGSFKLKAAVGRARDQVTSFADSRDPGYSASLETYVKLFTSPALTADVIREPFVGQPDWRQMFEAWNVINVAAMVVCSALYFFIETILDRLSFLAIIGAFFERLVHLLAFAVFSHVTWYMAVKRQGLCGPFICLGPHYFLVVALLYLYFMLESLWIADYEIFFVLLIPPTAYLCLICFKLFQLEQHAGDLQIVEPHGEEPEAMYDLQDLSFVEANENPAAQPLATSASEPMR